MIDYINATIEQERIGSHWENNCDLDFNVTTTKKGFVKKAKYLNMEFNVFEPSNISMLSGSLHYLFNDSQHNWNDFKRLDLFDTVHSFCEKFGIVPEKAICHSFEFGVNIIVPFNPSLFIENILAYKTGSIEHVFEPANKKHIVYVSFGQYRLKIYNKGLQFDKQNILRFEVKIHKMAKVAAIPQLKTMNDLLKIPVLQSLGNLLQTEFDSLIISEPMQIERMNKKEIDKFNILNNRDFWKSLNKLERSRAKKKFIQLTDKYGNGMHHQTSILVRQKWSELLEYNQKNDTFLQGGAIAIPNEEKTFLIPFDHLANMSKGISIIIRRKGIQNKCSHCRKPLNNKDSSYCNESCKEKKLKRNNRSNPNHQIKTKIEKIIRQPTLFEQTSFIKIQGNQIQWLNQKGIKLI